MMSSKRGKPVLRTTEGEIVERLDDKTAAEVGRIIARWSHIEWTLRMISYRAALVPEEIGRVAIRQDRCEGMIAMICDLQTLQEIRTTVDMKALGNLLTSIRLRRDQIAHGVWIVEQRTLLLSVLDISGTWPLGPDSPRVTKRMQPGALPVDEQFFAKLNADLDRAIEQLRTVYRETAAAQLASHEKRREQLAKDHRN